MDIEQERRQYEEKKAAKKLKSIIAPTIEERKKRVDSFKAVAYYIIIAIVLLIVTVVVPLLSGGITADDFGYYLPKSTQGWIIFWVIRAGTVLGNVTVYGLFKAQAKTNVQNDPSYIKATQLLNKMNGKEGFIPMSPKQKQRKDWTTKGIMMFFTTLSESVVIGVLIVNFDMVTFISSMISSITAVLFGIVQMIKDEIYWTEEYLLYAEYIDKKNKEKEMAEELAERKPEPTETAPESNETEVAKELSKEEIKEAENA